MVNCCLNFATCDNFQRYEKLKKLDYTLKHISLSKCSLFNFYMRLFSNRMGNHVVNHHKEIT